MRLSRTVERLSAYLYIYILYISLLVMADPLSSRQVTVLQRVAVCSSCSVLQFQVVALCYSVLHVLQFVDVLQLTAGASG